MLREVKTKYFVLMNNDVLVYENWLDKLLEPLDRNRNVGISSLYGVWDENEEMVYATFECVAIRTEIFQKIGGLDQRYGFGYYEDNDFSLQTKLLGWKIDYPRIGELLIDHLGGKTFGEQKRELLKKNVILFLKKWYPISKNNDIIKKDLLNTFNPFKWKVGFTGEEIEDLVTKNNSLFI